MGICTGWTINEFPAFANTRPLWASFFGHTKQLLKGHFANLT